MKNRFLIIGSSGLIASRAKLFLNSQDNIFAASTSFNPKEELFCDITNKKLVDQVIKRIKPTHVIHAANLKGGAYFCQQYPQEAKQFHFQSTKYLAEACRNINAKFVFISTECVFDGKKEKYVESDPLSPINVYGECKAKSEAWIQQYLKDYIIVRTMSVFGWQNNTSTPNAVMSAYFAAKEKKIIDAASYRFCTPTYVDDLALAIIELTQSNRRGIYHVAGKTYLSRYDWLKRTFKYMKWNAKYLKEVKSPRETDIAYPHKIRLVTKKFESEFKTKLHTLNQSLSLLKKDFLAYKD